MDEIVHDQVPTTEVLESIRGRPPVFVEFPVGEAQQFSHSVHPGVEETVKPSYEAEERDEDPAEQKLCQTRPSDGCSSEIGKRLKPIHVAQKAIA
jgi:hypothetical protein